MPRPCWSRPDPANSARKCAWPWIIAWRRDTTASIVIDGNGKDGLEAIPAFVEALEAGWDHVQGSRYIAGGHHENTPLVTPSGGRALHAPLISLASGFHYTDTTNGFRAYSRRLLLDPAIDIFRPCFDRYQLHYYLAIEAARRGYRVKEIPVSRVYPPSGKTPTKIKGFGGSVRGVGAIVRCLPGKISEEKLKAESRTAETTEATPHQSRSFLPRTVPLAMDFHAFCLAAFPLSAHAGG